MHPVFDTHFHIIDPRFTVRPAFDTISNLPKVSIDHLGMTQEGLPNLLKLAECGVKVKATGFGRTEVDVPSALRDLVRANPHCLMFGSDLPSQRARRPFLPSDMVPIRETLGDTLAQKVFFDNAVEFYRPVRLAR